MIMSMNAVITNQALQPSDMKLLRHPECCP